MSRASHSAGVGATSSETGDAGQQTAVNRVFARVADRYDLMNDLMSGGLHRLWKDDLVGWLAPAKRGPYLALDMAGGTGDVARRLLDMAGPDATCVVCDISPEMLRVGHARAAGANPGRLSFVQADAQALPFANASADAYTIAFGIRNVPDIDGALREARRVLRPGGRFVCLEFAHVDIPVLDALYARYSDLAIPALGALVAGDAGPYRYLVDSIRRFPDQERFAAAIARAGLERVQYRNLSGGIAALHSAWRL